MTAHAGFTGNAQPRTQGFHALGNVSQPRTQALSSTLLPGYEVTLHYYSAHSPLRLFSDRLHEVLRLLMLLTQPRLFIFTTIEILLP